MTNYFYFENDQKHGPVDEKQIKELIAQGIVKPQTVVENDSGHKVQAWQISDLYFEQSSTPAQSTRADFPQVKSTDSDEIKKLDKYFTALKNRTVPCIWLASVGTVELVLCLAIILWGKMIEPLTRDAEGVFLFLMTTGSGLLCLASLFFVCAVVYQFLLVYQLWKVIPPQFARTTPGKAVGFMFIPIFNLYWNFIAYYGLGIDMNKTLREQGISYQVNERLGLLVCFLTFAFIIVSFVFGDIGVWLTMLAEAIVLYLFLKSVTHGAITVLQQKCVDTEKN